MVGDLTGSTIDLRNGESLNYLKILKLPMDEFLIALEQYKVAVHIETGCREEIIHESLKLTQIAANYTVLTSLYQYAKYFKRDLHRKGAVQEYEDMIDKEQILSAAMKATDMVYRALSKLVTEKMEESKELYMLKDIA